MKVSLGKVRGGMLEYEPLDFEFEGEIFKQINFFEDDMPLGSFLS